MATKDEYLRAVDLVDEPFATASEVAEIIGVTRQAAHKHLQELVDEGRLKKKKIGASAVIWWTGR